MLSWTDEMVMDGIFTRNPSLEGTIHEVKQVKDDQTKRHVVHFLADPRLKASLAKLQTGSSTFYLKLGGQDRRTVMARDPLVVAVEEAAELKGRVERALAKAIEASRPDLVLQQAIPDHLQQQQQPQQGNYATDHIKEKHKPIPDSSHFSGLGEAPGAPAVPDTEFVRVWKEMEAERVALEQQQREQQQQQQLEWQHQHEQQQRLELHQQKQVNQFEAERLRLQQGSTPIQQQLREQKGKANFNIIKYLSNKQDPSPPGVVKGRVASLEVASSPPQGVDMRTLESGLPPADNDNYSVSSPGSSSSEAVGLTKIRAKPTLNSSTGSTKVDTLVGLEDLGDSDMEGLPEDDPELYALARTGNELEDDMGEDS
jgi:hypothetical protein